MLAYKIRSNFFEKNYPDHYNEGKTMKFTTFMTEVREKNMIEIPVEIREKLDVHTGDKLEITLKKVKSRRLEILISENPLYKLIKFAE